MDVRAAVAHKAGAPLTIETVQLESPRAGECLVEIKASCGSSCTVRSDADFVVPAVLPVVGRGPKFNKK